MKKLFLQGLSLMVLLILASGFAAMPDTEAIVKIDGKLITPDGELTFNRDDTVYLEATGIKPHSDIHIKVKKLGIAWMQDDYKVDKSGEVKGIMHIPEEKLTVNCFIEYYSADGKFHEVQFKCKTR
ncbi:MAG: hypothetical protein U0176_01225 [Bacteroidia bacterium]